jgi:ORF6N domain-containing protein
MSKEMIPIERIAHAIVLIREWRVMFDYRLAVLYGIETLALKQAVRRNPDRARAPA